MNRYPVPSRAIAAVALAVTLLAALAAYAMSKLYLVTPKTLVSPKRTFSITARKKDDLIAFVVVSQRVKESQDLLDPAPEATLTLTEGGRRLAETPIAVTHEKDRLICRFAVAPSALAESEFMLGEAHYVILPNGEGWRVRGGAAAEGGVSYLIRLGDFPPAKTAPAAK